MRDRTRGAVLTLVGLLGLALAGCGAGQGALTSQIEPSVPGVSARTDDSSVLIRNAFLVDAGGGYPAGGEAPVSLNLVNQTGNPIRLVSASSPVARSIAVDSPAGAAGDRATIPANQVVSLTLQLTDLAEPVRGGGSVPLELRFDNGGTVSLEVPVAAPVSPTGQPAPRESMTVEEEH